MFGSISIEIRKCVIYLFIFSLHYIDSMIFARIITPDSIVPIEFTNALFMNTERFSKKKKRRSQMKDEKKKEKKKNRCYQN